MKNLYGDSIGDVFDVWMSNWSDPESLIIDTGAANGRFKLPQKRRNVSWWNLKDINIYEPLKEINKDKEWGWLKFHLKHCGVSTHPLVVFKALITNLIRLFQDFIN